MSQPLGHSDLAIFVSFHCTTQQGKEVFLSYRGVETVLPFMRPSNKALCSHAVDVYLQLAVESGILIF